MASSTSGYSLERSLLARLLGVLALLGVGLFWLVATYADRAADRAYDRLLQAAALAVADTVVVEDGRIMVDLPYASLGILAMARRDRVFYRISAPDGRMLTGYEDLALSGPAQPSREPRFVDTDYRGAPVRAAVLGRLLPEPEVRGWVTIVVAQTREERDAFAREILRNAFAPIGLTLLVGAGLIWFGVRRALAPLGDLERLIRARRPADLRPIEAPVPAEVGQLLQALNHFMVRLQASLAAMQTFLADAAHQIRTPLASLRAQADLARDEEDVGLLRQEVEKIHRNAATASQLTNQLLSQAMVTHRRSTLESGTVDVVALARQVVQRAEATAAVPVTLDFSDAAGGALIEGDPVILREALANLVDNAIKYGRNSAVEIRLARLDAAGRLRLEVLDRGPGIPDAEKASVLERFTRGRTASAVIGSGLGLAIVKAVAEAHDATLQLIDRPGGGLITRLEFKLPAATAAPGGSGVRPRCCSSSWA